MPQVGTVEEEPGERFSCVAHDCSSTACLSHLDPYVYHHQNQCLTRMKQTRLKMLRSFDAHRIVLKYGSQVRRREVLTCRKWKGYVG